MSGSRVRRTYLAVLAMTLAALPAAAQGTARSRIDTFAVRMPQTLQGRERTVRVYLPPGYDASQARYPVLYLQDGQNLFSPGPYGDWRVDETVDSLVAAGRIPGLIVVGIDHGGARRWDEYGPWTNDAMARWVDLSWAEASEGGEGSLYARWLVNRLKPEIDRRYRTLPGPEHTGIGGSSMGGLIALYTGVYRPDVFGRVMAMSPAVWFAETEGPWLAGNMAVAMIRAWDTPVAARFWIDVGGDERSRARDPDVRDAQGRPLTYPRAYVEGARAVADALRERGVPAENLNYGVEQGAVHSEGAWAGRLAEAVLWLFR
jgi:predicted alpha/beta superfamily hydrolase